MITQADILIRLKKYSPIGWFANSNLYDAIMNAAAAVFYQIYQGYLYLFQQSRIRTSTGEFLDYASEDFLGDFLPRRQDESDEDFKRRLLPSLLPYPPTRQGMIDALTNIIGVKPAIYESQYNGMFLNVNSFLNHNSFGFNCPYQGVIVLNPNVQPSLTIPVYALNQTFFLNDTSFVFSYDETINPVWTLEDIRLIIERFKVYGTILYLNDFTQLRSIIPTLPLEPPVPSGLVYFALEDQQQFLLEDNTLFLLENSTTS